MKKLFSSVFVILILLNIMGYYGVFLGLQYKNSYTLRQHFDAGTYDETLTEVFKIPFDAPDSLSSELYERVDGDFERDGEVYRIIKKRLYRDTFHVVYMKDTRGTALQKALNDVAKTFADQPQQKSQNKISVPYFMKEYFTKSFSIHNDSPGWVKPVLQTGTLTTFLETFEVSIVHPPERA